MKHDHDHRYPSPLRYASLLMPTVPALISGWINNNACWWQNSAGTAGRRLLPFRRQCSLPGQVLKTADAHPRCSCSGRRPKYMETIRLGAYPVAVSISIQINMAAIQMPSVPTAREYSHGNMYKYQIAENPDGHRTSSPGGLVKMRDACPTGGTKRGCSRSNA